MSVNLIVDSQNCGNTLGTRNISIEDVFLVIDSQVCSTFWWQVWSHVNNSRTGKR